MKKAFCITAIATVLAASAGIASAQPVQLSNDWKVEGGAQTWFPASGDTVRGMAKIPAGNLLVVSRTDGNFLRRLDPATGAEVAPPVPNATYSGGTHIVAKAAVSADGIIYASNLAIAAGNYRIYRHANESSEATIAYEEIGAAARLGDDMDINGTGNNMVILVAMSGTGTVAKFTTADSGLTFTKSLLTLTNPTVSGTPAISFEPAGTHFWFRNSGGSAGGRYDIGTGTGAGLSIARPSSSLYGPIRIGTLDGTLYYALSSGNVSAGNVVMVGELYEPSNLAAPPFPQEDPPVYGGLLYTSPSVRPAAGMNTNTNGAGQVVFADDKVYWLVTNNVIARDSFPSNVNDWNLF